MVLAACFTSASGFELNILANGVGMVDGLKLGDEARYESASFVSNRDITSSYATEGHGNSVILHQVDGQGYSVANSIESSGSLASAASTSASQNGAYFSQKSLISGDSGGLSSVAASENSHKILTAGFNGKGGDVMAILDYSAGQTPTIDGDIYVNGLKGLEAGEDHPNTASVVSGLYSASDGGLGNFGICAANIQDSESSAMSIYNPNDLNPSVTYNSNSSSSYAKGNIRWVSDPDMWFYLNNDAQFAKTGLNVNKVCSAVSSAASTWDAATSQDLFGEVVPESGDFDTESFDRTQVIGWKPISSNVLAYTRTVYACNWWLRGADGNVYKLALDSDICFNSNCKWTTDASGASNAFDVQTVALHELGHVYGLADLYDLSASDPRKGDYYQIMNAYDGLQRNLGAGDISGIQSLYGR